MPQTFYTQAELDAAVAAAKGETVYSVTWGINGRLLAGGWKCLLELPTGVAFVKVNEAENRLAEAYSLARKHIIAQLRSIKTIRNKPVHYDVGTVITALERMSSTSESEIARREMDLQRGWTCTPIKDEVQRMVLENLDRREVGKTYDWEKWSKAAHKRIRKLRRKLKLKTRELQTPNASAEILGELHARITKQHDASKALAESFKNREPRNLHTTEMMIRHQENASSYRCVIKFIDERRNRN